MSYDSEEEDTYLMPMKKGGKVVKKKKKVPKKKVVKKKKLKLKLIGFKAPKVIQVAPIAPIVNDGTSVRTFRDLSQHGGFLQRREIKTRPGVAMGPQDAMIQKQSKESKTKQPLQEVKPKINQMISQLSSQPSFKQLQLDYYFPKPSQEDLIIMEAEKGFKEARKEAMKKAMEEEDAKKKDVKKQKLNAILQRVQAVQPISKPPVEYIQIPKRLTLKDVKGPPSIIPIASPITYPPMKEQISVEKRKMLRIPKKERILPSLLESDQQKQNLVQMNIEQSLPILGNLFSEEEQKVQPQKFKVKIGKGAGKGQVLEVQ
jgi:hypothetical protein